VLVSIHVAAMGLWVGGLAAFLVVPDRRFGRYAALCFAVAAISGLVLAVAHVGLLQALMTTVYGQVLMIKVLVVAAALSMALIRRRRLESGLLLAVIAAAAVLAALPPPR
jgi:putative copper export protein